MPAAWKLALTAVLYCSCSIQSPGADSCLAANRQTCVRSQPAGSLDRTHSGVDDADGIFLWNWIPVDVAEVLNRDSEWIHARFNRAVPVEMAPEIPSTTEPEPGRMEADGIEVTVAELFRPLRSLRASGPSSAPPSLPNDQNVESLQRPEDLAGDYAETSFPSYYATTGFGPRRPPRNTHRFYSNPLYYEDPNLERCGRSPGCLTTAISVFHFASRAAMTPYLMTLDHPNSCVAALPDCPTCHKFGCDVTCPRWSLKAAIVQGAAVTGLIYVIP